jgi:hypothetical protein
MEEQLTRIADAFERIAASLSAIHHEGLEIWSKPNSLRLDINEMPLPDMPYPMEFPSDLSIELRNASYGTKTIPFKIQP